MELKKLQDQLREVNAQIAEARHRERRKWFATAKEHAEAPGKIAAMKKISRTLLVAMFAIIAHSSYASEACKSRVISGFVADTFYQDPAALVSSFRKSPFNTISTTVAWSVAEQHQGKIDLSMYYPQFDALTKGGYCLIVLLDTSGRLIASTADKTVVKMPVPIPDNSKPDWVASAAPDSSATDFDGGVSRTLDYNDPKALGLVRDFYHTVLSQLKRRYGDKLVAAAPCVMAECEIKYAQVGFKWESFGPQSKKAFNKYLASKGLPANAMPVINYANDLSKGNPRPQPMYPYMQAFREAALKDYICTLTSEIRRSRITSMGYFGQVFAFTDGIYATGEIEQTTGCFDIAAIDYNFYNGYGVEIKPGIVPFLTDYAISLGYSKVVVGTYMERLRDIKTNNIDQQGYDLLRSSIQGIRPDPHILGVEIGNLMLNEFPKINYIKTEVKGLQQASASAPHRVAVYASVANSYLWQGEWSNGRQIIQDDLIETYMYLRTMPGVKVDIVSDESIRKNGLRGYQLIVLPHLTAMPEVSRSAIKSYLARGGKVMADMRVDEYKTDGSLQTDPSLRSALGIGATQAVSGKITLVRGVTIDQQKQYVNGFALAPMAGFRIAYASRPGNGEGLILQGKNSTVFGFLPLLVEGKRKTWARDQFRSEVERLLD